MTKSSKAPPRRVRPSQAPEPSFEGLEPPIVQDAQRANLYSLLLSGTRDEFLKGGDQTTPRELLALLHRYLVLSEPRVPVHQFVIDDITIRAMKLVTGEFIAGEEGEWLWDVLFGQGIAKAARHQGPWCGVKALQYYGLLGKAVSDHFVRVPPKIALHLMATLVDDQLLERHSTATHLRTSFPQRSWAVLGCSGSVTVPMSIFPPDEVMPSEEPTVYFDWALRTVAEQGRSQSGVSPELL